MDRAFMEHYFDITFDDVVGEIAGNDEHYAKLHMSAECAVDDLADIVGRTNSAAWKQCEEVIGRLLALQPHLAKLAYLRGAEDREKMLR